MCRERVKWFVKHIASLAGSWYSFRFSATDFMRFGIMARDMEKLAGQQLCEPGESCEAYVTIERIDGNGNVQASDT